MRELCQPCCWQLHPVMLTGYCLIGKCERCGRVTDLAVVRLKADGQPALPLEEYQ